MPRNYFLEPKPPISRLTFSIKEDPLSKRILTLDNITYHSSDYSSELGIHVTTNESGAHLTFDRLSASRSSKKSCHIGVSGWFNLDVIAARGTERGIIFDSNPEVSLFFDHTFKCIISSPDRDTFIGAIKACVAKFDYERLNVPESLLKYSFRCSPNLLMESEYDTSPEHEIDIHAHSAAGWLKNETSYQFIRHLVLTNKIVVVTADITHHLVFEKIRRLLDDNGIAIDTLYLSNVHNYITTENQDAFLKTFLYVSDDHTLLIDADAATDIKNSGLEQRIISCGELESTEKQLARWFSNPSDAMSDALNQDDFSTPVQRNSLFSHNHATRAKKEANTCCSFKMAALIILPVLSAMLITYMYHHFQQSDEISPLRP